MLRLRGLYFVEQARQLDNTFYFNLIYFYTD